MRRTMRGLKRSFLTSFLLAIGLSFELAGCAAGGMFDQLPASMGGEPVGVPARPDKPYQYPAVHDMPPPRATAPMTDEEQAKTEKELEALRDRQEGKQEPVKKAPRQAKKKPLDIKSRQTSGTGTNP